MRKFHEIVNQGPVYVCSCCDKLWYKYSVLHTHNIDSQNVDKYLCNKTSVDNKEWVCITCHSYFIKNNVLPCAILNGMKFPDKPDFCDLNE